MAVYNDGNIYGIAFVIYDENGDIINRVEKIYPNKIGFPEIREIKKEYNKLTKKDLEYIKIKVYTSCTTTYDISITNKSRTFMCWFPSDMKTLNQMFLKAYFRN
jgi:hypothetical protein